MSNIKFGLFNMRQVDGPREIELGASGSNNNGDNNVYDHDSGNHREGGCQDDSLPDLIPGVRGSDHSDAPDDNQGIEEFKARIHRSLRFYPATPAEEMIFSDLQDISLDDKIKNIRFELVSTEDGTKRSSSAKSKIAAFALLVGIVLLSAYLSSLMVLKVKGECIGDRCGAAYASKDVVNNTVVWPITPGVVGTSYERPSDDSSVYANTGSLIVPETCSVTFPPISGNTVFCAWSFTTPVKAIIHRLVNHDINLIRDGNTISVTAPDSDAQEHTVSPGWIYYCVEMLSLTHRVSVFNKIVSEITHKATVGDNIQQISGGTDPKPPTTKCSCSGSLCNDLSGTALVFNTVSTQIIRVKSMDFNNKMLSGSTGAYRYCASNKDYSETCKFNDVITPNQRVALMTRFYYQLQYPFDCTNQMSFTLDATGDFHYASVTPGNWCADSLSVAGVTGLIRRIRIYTSTTGAKINIYIKTPVEIVGLDCTDASTSFAAVTVIGPSMDLSGSFCGGIHASRMRIVGPLQTYGIVSADHVDLSMESVFEITDIRLVDYLCSQISQTVSGIQFDEIAVYNGNVSDKLLGFSPIVGPHSQKGLIYLNSYNRGYINSQIGSQATPTCTLGQTTTVPQKNLVEYGGRMKCKPRVDLSYSKCDSDCLTLLTKSTCSGSKNYCDSLIEYSSLINDASRSTMCTPKTDSMCECDIISDESVTFAGLKGAPADFEVKQFPIYDKSKHHKALVGDVRDVYRHLADDFWLRTRSLTTSVKRRLLSDDPVQDRKQFKVEKVGKTFKVSQDITVRDCSECRTTTLYRMVFEHPLYSGDTFFHGLYNVLPEPVELNSALGVVKWQILDMSETDLEHDQYTRTAEDYNTNDKGEDRDTTGDDSYMGKVMSLWWPYKIMLVVCWMVAIALSMISVFVLFKIIKYVWKWISSVAEDLEVFCCCKKASAVISKGVNKVKIIAERANKKAKGYSIVSTKEKIDNDTVIDVEKVRELEKEKEPMINKRIHGGDSSDVKPSSRVFISMLVCSLSIASMVNPVAGNTCGNGISITVPASECSGGYCSSVYVATLSLPTGGADACLDLYDEDGKDFLGQLTISHIKTRFTNDYSAEYGTTDWTGIWASIHRCDHTDDCGSSHLDPQEDRGGLFSKADQRLMNYPGLSEGHSSSGCAGAGCFYCSDACTFSRYAMVTDSGPFFVVYKKQTTITRQEFLKVSFMSQDGTVSVIHDGELNTGFDVTKPFRDTTITLINQGSLNSGYAAPPAPETFLSSSDYQCGTNGNLCGGVCFRPSAFVSESSKPVAGTIGDLQFPISGPTKDNTIWSRDIVTKSTGKTDTYQFVKSGVSTNVPGECWGQADKNKWALCSLNDLSSALCLDQLTLIDPIVITAKIASGKLTMRQQINNVCPVFTKAPVVYGNWSETSGCSVQFSAKSTCQPGVRPISVTGPLKFLVPSVKLSNEEQQYVMAATCSKKYMSSVDFTFCGGSGCKSSGSSAVVLTDSVKVTTGSNQYSDVTQNLADGKEKNDGFKWEDPHVESIGDKIMSFLSSLVGMGPGILGTILGTLLLLAIAAILVFSSPFVYRAFRSLYRRSKSMNKTATKDSSKTSVD